MSIKNMVLKKKVTILVEETIKGSEKIRKLDLFYYPSLSVEPEYIYDERAIFFIKKWKGKYTTVQGHAGKVSIDKGFVKPIFIKGEVTSQPLQEFIQRIRSADK